MFTSTQDYRWYKSRVAVGYQKKLTKTNEMKNQITIILTDDFNMILDLWERPKTCVKTL